MTEVEKKSALVDYLIAAADYQVDGTHYTDMTIDPWAVADTWPLEQRIGVYRHGAVKYLMRMGKKDDDLVEAKKAYHYCQKLVETLENGRQPQSQDRPAP